MNECTYIEDYFLNRDNNLSIAYVIGESSIKTLTVDSGKWLEASRLEGLCDDFDEVEVIIYTETHYQGPNKIESNEHTHEISINTFFDQLTPGGIRRILRQLLNKSIKQHATNRGIAASD